MSALFSATISSTTSGNANDDAWQEVAPDVIDASKDSDKVAAHDSDEPMSPVDSEASVDCTSAPAPTNDIPPVTKPPCPCARCVQGGGTTYYPSPVYRQGQPATPWNPNEPCKPTATLFCQEESGKSNVAKIFLPRTYEETKAAALRAFPDILKAKSDAQPKEFDVKIRIRTHALGTVTYGAPTSFVWASVHADDWWEMLSELARQNPMDPVELQVEMKGCCEGLCPSRRMQPGVPYYSTYPPSPYPTM